MARPSIQGPELAERLRLLRAERGLTLAEMAAKAGVTKGFLSQVEHGMKAPSIPTLLRIANVFGVDLGELFQNRTSEAPAHSLVRVHERQKYAREGSLFGYRYEAIAFRKAAKKMEPFIISPPYRAPRKLFSHHGDEMILVLSGRIQVNLDGKLIALDPGDCLYFDASTPHCSRSLGRKPARAVVVVSVGIDVRRRRTAKHDLVIS